MQVRMIRDFKAMQQWTATLLTIEGSKDTIAAIRAKKVLSASDDALTLAHHIPCM